MGLATNATPETLPHAPWYVRACAQSPWPEKPLILRMWPVGQDPATGSRRPHRCGSWRCPACQGYRAAVDFRRIHDALSGEDPRSLCFLVLTLDRDGTYTGAAWADQWSAYRELSRMTRNLLAALRRRFPDIGSSWVGVVEAHRSGWPHFNLVVCSKRLARVLRRSFGERAQSGLAHRDCILLQGELLGCALATGWGPQSTGEAARNVQSANGAIAGYMVKLARGRSGPLAGEARKLSQVPDVAPDGFRRLRSGRRFLPPRRRAEGWTGALLQRRGDAVALVGRRGRRTPKARKLEAKRALEVEAATTVIHGPGLLEPPSPAPRQTRRCSRDRTSPATARVTASSSASESILTPDTS